MTSRHLPYFELIDALQSDGCAVCRLSDAAARRYLQSISGEFVTDPAVRDRIRNALGFCRHHFAELEEVADPLARSILYEDLINRMERELDSWCRPRWRKSPPPECPACASHDQQVEHSLRVLADGLRDEEMRRAYDASGGLCRAHLIRLCGTLPAQLRSSVVEKERARLRSLADELREVQRKHDHRYQSEEWGTERTATERAMRKLSRE